MKTLVKIILCGLFVTGMLVSCDETPGIPVYTTEDSKDKLDSDLAAMVSDIADVKDLKSISVIDSVDNLDINSPIEMFLPEVTEGTSFEDYEEALIEGLLSITLSNQLLWGTYTYQLDNDTYSFEEGAAGKLSIICPSSNSSESNDLELTVSLEIKDGLSYDDITFDYIDENYAYHYEVDTIFLDYDYNGDNVIDNNDYWIDYYNYYDDTTIDTITATVIIEEIFTSAKVEIKQNSTTLLAFEWAVELDNEGIPNRMTSSMTVEQYELSTEIDATNRNEQINHTSSLTKNGTELIGYTITLDGDLSDEKIGEIIDEIYDFEEMDEKNPSDAYIKAQEYNLIAELRFSNFIIKGLANSQKFSEALDIEDNNDLNTYTQRADVINEALDLKLIHKDGAAFADVDFYTREKVYEWDDDYNYYLDMRFNFTDGTSTSVNDDNIEDELEAIFNSLITSIEDLVEDFENL